MRDVIFLQSCPDDDYYIWQVHIWLESLRKIEKSNKAVSCIFIPNNRQKNNKWDKIVELYPEAEFFFKKDEENVISKILPFYIPILRPWTIKKYFDLHPELKEKAIFYVDCDVVFTEKFNIDKFLDDDVNYLSNTNSYINASYFDSKMNDVLPSKLEKYKTIDVLQELTHLCGVSREIAEKYNNHSGGAQYLLKNINSDFWDKVYTDSIVINKYLKNINTLYFENNDKGFQHWCADMWAVLWGIWYIGGETKVVPELNFAWPTDPITHLDNMTIFHNAGIDSAFHSQRKGDKDVKIPVFHKGFYHTGLSPFNDKLYLLQNNELNKTLCNNFYINKMIEIKEKYNLEY